MVSRDQLTFMSGSICLTLKVVFDPVSIFEPRINSSEDEGRKEETSNKKKRWLQYKLTGR